MSSTEAAVDIFSVANWFIKRGKQDKIPISHKKLQKLLYYAKHWSLYEAKDSVLEIKLPKRINIEVEFEAWVHGAVCRKVFRKYRDYGFDDLTQAIKDDDLDTDNLNKEVEKFLEKIWNVYKDCSANKLEYMNHQDQTWLNQRLDLSKETLTDRKITEADMRLNRPQIPH